MVLGKFTMPQSWPTCSTFKLKISPWQILQICPNRIIFVENFLCEKIEIKFQDCKDIFEKKREQISNFVIRRKVVKSFVKKNKFFVGNQTTNENVQNCLKKLLTGKKNFIIENVCFCQSPFGHCKSNIHEVSRENYFPFYLDSSKCKFSLYILWKVNKARSSASATNELNL